YLYVTQLQANAAVAAADAAQQARASVANTNRAKVVVAKQTLAAQTVLSADNVEQRDVSADALQPNAVTALSDAVGKALTLPVAANQQILNQYLGNPDQPDVKKLADLVPAGKRAMSVTFTELNTAGGLVAPGDYVDVIGVFNKNTLGKDQSMLLMQDILVLAIARDTSADQLPRAGAPAGGQVQQALPQPQRGTAAVPLPQPTPASVAFAPDQTRTLTLAVDPEAAERLALAEDYGHLRYIVRPGTERNQSAVVPADLTTLASPIQVAAGQILATEIT